jgi:LysR family transcriptional regulator, nod-box dependent transcriptional activator
MNLKGLDLNLLIVLDVLLAEKNTMRAAERISLSQSATSGALARLREYFGDPLLVRSGRKLVLSSLAQRLVEPVRQMLTQCETIIDCNVDFNPETSSRKFRLNMGEEVAAGLMRDVFRKIKRIGPGITVEIYSYPGQAWFSRDLAQYLEQGDLDLLIAPTQLLSPLHPSKKLYNDRAVCVVWSGNRHVGKSISLAQYFSLGHVVTKLGPQQAPPEEELFFRKSGRRRRIEIALPSFGLPAYYVIGTDFVATMYESLARLYAQYLPIRILPLPVATPPLEMNMQWHRYQDHDPGIKWLREVIGKVAEGIVKSETRSKRLSKT